MDHLAGQSTGEQFTELPDEPGRQTRPPRVVIDHIHRLRRPRREIVSRRFPHDTNEPAKPERIKIWYQPAAVPCRAPRERPAVVLSGAGDYLGLPGYEPGAGMTPTL